MLAKWWLELTHKFPSVEIDEHAVMPNHLHGIVVIAPTVGATLCGRPSVPATTHRASLDGDHTARDEGGHPHRGAPTLGDVVGWFKTMTTNEYIRGVKQLGWLPFQGKLWQRNYYEHIIRNEAEFHQIRKYIATNPARWAADPENPGAAQSGRGDPTWSPFPADARTGDAGALRYGRASTDRGHPRRRGLTNQTDSLRVASGLERPWERH